MNITILHGKTCLLCANNYHFFSPSHLYHHLKREDSSENIVQVFQSLKTQQKYFSRLVRKSSLEGRANGPLMFILPGLRFCLLCALLLKHTKHVHTPSPRFASVALTEMLISCACLSKRKSSGHLSACICSQPGPASHTWEPRLNWMCATLRHCFQVTRLHLQYLNKAS